MKRLGVVFALLVLFSVLSVSVVPVRAETTTYSAVAYLYTENEINLDLAVSTLGGTLNGEYVLAYKSVGLSSPLEIRVYSQKIEVWYSGQSLNDLLPALRVLDPSDVATAGTVELSDIFLVNEAVQVFNDLVTNGAVSGNYYGLDLRFMPNGARVWYHYAVGRGSEGTTTGSTVTAGNNTYLVSFEGSAGNHIDDLVKVEIGGTVIVQTDGDYVKGYKVGSWSGSVVGSIQDSTGTSGYVYVILTYFDGDVVVSSPFGFLRYFDIGAYTATVTFSFKDALSGESLNGVTVKEGDTVLGTIDDGGTLEIGMGTHTLTFEKAGYWSKTLTIDVQGDMSVNVELYPDNYVIIASSQVSDVYQYSQGVATLSVQVVEGSGYGYSTKVAISGVEVSKVTWNGGVVNPGDDGKYYLGDIGSSPGELKIYFKAGEVLGNRSFRVTFTTYDSLANMKANEYTITYSVQEPPFKVTLPSWKVGVNTVRVTDQSGTDRVISIILYDENGTEVYSDSQSLLSYGSVEFNVPIDSLDGYLLEVRSNDGISLYFDVTAQVPIVLKTETVQVSGSTGEVTVEISNSGNSVAYYKLIVEGEPIDNSTAPVEVSLAPGETKTINVPFKLRDGLTLDTYEATIKAMDSQDTVVWSSTFIIRRSSGFALPISGVSSEDALGMGAVAILGLGGLVLVIRRKRRG